MAVEFEEKTLERLASANMTEKALEEEKSSALEYQLMILQQLLAECDDLLRGPSAPRHLILVGHSYDGDGSNFKIVAATQVREMTRQICKTPESNPQFETCKNSIVVKEDISKGHLQDYFRFLGPGSVKSIHYIGHGFESGIVIGPKSLLLPPRWDESLKITKAEWKRLNQGTLISDDIDSKMAADLNRVVAPGAPIRFISCDTGLDLAPRVQKAVPLAQVIGETTSMHFEYWDTKKGRWVSPGSAPVPRDAPAARMVTDRFRGVKDFVDFQIDSVVQSHRNAYDRKSKVEDRATRNIVYKLVSGGANRAELEFRAFQFSNEEVALLREVSSRWVKGKSYVDFKGLTYDALIQGIDEMNAQVGERKRVLLDRLTSKIQASVSEAARIYYK